ncbi:uncharacterized protein LOC123547083 [Mercenaria mercenaria]|uniref:uncharacterized protein LOC123547083 n=1 Tax=Mercenaria mercenaria TaxID=6596 RepID=UPI00234F8EA8|nr:uncharacterized protein LOC123547083 [Mercenaria mercenaria]
MSARGKGSRRGRRRRNEPDIPTQDRNKRQRRSFDNDNSAEDRDVWLMGDSIPYWAGVRAQARGMPNLKLPEGHTIAWWGIRGMGWSDFIHCIQLPVLFRSAPKVLVFHLGGNDVKTHTLRYIFKLIQESLEYTQGAFPDSVYVWVDILQRLNWGCTDEQEQKAVEKKRKRINQFGHKIIKKVSPTKSHVLRMDIDAQTPGFFRGDGVHLSDVGLEMYLDSLHDMLVNIFKL